MWRVGGIRPRVINVDGHAAYSQAIRELKASGELGRQCQCRPTPYLNNVLEQDHRFVKKRMAASLWFRNLNAFRLPHATLMVPLALAFTGALITRMDTRGFGVVAGTF